MATQTVAIANVRAYLQRVGQLYADVRHWMAVLEPDAQYSETEIELIEEATRPYKAISLEIARPSRPALRLIPRGRYMVGAEGCVDIRSRLGRETLVWVRAGGPAVGFRYSPGNGEAPEELSGPLMFPAIAEGWAWSDEDRGELLHLDLAVFHDDGGIPQPVPVGPIAVRHGPRVITEDATDLGRKGPEERRRYRRAKAGRAPRPSHTIRSFTGEGPPSPVRRRCWREGAGGRPGRRPRVVHPAAVVAIRKLNHGRDHGDI